MVALTLLAVPPSSRAQPAGKVYRVGHATSGTRDQTMAFRLAKHLGLTMPPSLLAQADGVIE